MTILVIIFGSDSKDKGHRSKNKQAGLHQTNKLLHSERNHQRDEEATLEEEKVFAPLSSPAWLGVKYLSSPPLPSSYVHQHVCVSVLPAALTLNADEVTSSPVNTRLCLHAEKPSSLVRKGASECSVSSTRRQEQSQPLISLMGLGSKLCFEVSANFVSGESSFPRLRDDQILALFSSTNAV